MKHHVRWNNYPWAFAVAVQEISERGGMGGAGAVEFSGFGIVFIPLHIICLVFCGESRDENTYCKHCMLTWNACLQLKPTKLTTLGRSLGWDGKTEGLWHSRYDTTKCIHQAFTGNGDDSMCAKYSRSWC